MVLFVLHLFVYFSASDVMNHYWTASLVTLCHTPMKSLTPSSLERGKGYFMNSVKNQPAILQVSVSLRHKDPIQQV